MKIIKPQVLSLLTRPFELAREFWLGVSVIAFLPVGEHPALLKEAAMWPFLAEELPPDQPLDAGIPKSDAEFLAIAHCHAPDGTPAPLVRTGIQLGPVIKMLDVYGDRSIDRPNHTITPPEPFTHMAMNWTNTYGGPEFPDNPLGRGIAPAPGSGGETIPVQNVINPRLGREGARNPAGYGPIDQMWPARAGRAGTYDDAWLRNDFPGLARDTDWRFFNLAPPDQWLADPPRGDETYAFKHLHPEKKLLKGRLPGMAPRLFLVRKSDEDGFEEVPLTLTTVWFFPHRERLALIHHGRARLAEEDASDIARVVVGADRLGHLRPAADYHAVMMTRLDRQNGATAALRDQDLVPGEWLDPADAPPPPQIPLAVVRGHRRAEQEREEAVARAKAKGLDPAKFAPPPVPPLRPPPTLEELPAFAAAEREKAEAAKAAALAETELKKTEAARELAKAGMQEDDIQKRLNPETKGPPAFSAAATIEQLQAQVRGMRVLGQMTMALEERLADPGLPVHLAKAEAAARDSYRLIAHLQAPADALPAGRTAEIRALIAAGTPAARALYDLHGADLSGLDLSGLDLSGICFDGANLAGTVLRGANLTRAVLAHANLSGACLDDAILNEANLGKAMLTGASLRGASMKQAVLAGADLTRASLAGADLARADLSEIVIEETDFTGIRAEAMLAMKLSLRGFQAPGAYLPKAKFIECDLQGADLTGATLRQAVFLQTNLAGIRLARACLIKAVFVKQCSLLGANLVAADLTEANLRETMLRGANLNGATIEKADLSGADLSNTILTHVNGRASLLVAADLRRADLRLSDFAHADLARTDLRGANLTSLSVFEANMPRTKLDAETRRGGMFRTRMRYLPVWEPSA